jgi:hypothetical protein
MRRRRARHAGALAAGLALLGAAPAPVAAPTETEVLVEPALPASAARVGTEPFAVLLAREAPVSGPDAWPVLTTDEAWAGIMRGGSTGRQPGRWAFARALIGRGMGNEAVGILQVMRADDPDLAFVDSFRLALGAAHTLARQPAEAVAALDAPSLANHPEACAWRLLAQDQQGVAVGSAARCAVAAVDARPSAQRRPWLLAIARSALGAGSASGADAALRGLPDTDPEANLLRGKAMLILADPEQARFRFRRAEKDGSGAVKAAASLVLLKQRLEGPRADPAARTELDRLLRGWRGDRIEHEGLLLAHKSALRENDVPVALDTGQALLDYHDLGADAGPLLARLQAMMAALIEPSNGRPLDVAAGLFWEHRVLLPPGAEGDRLVQLLAARLEGAGLFRRAAELLRHQMVARAQDVAMGALSIRVATLYLKAGQPETAIATIRETGRTPYPEEMFRQREQLRAVALAQLGRKAEAVALLESVPGSEALRAEIHWHAEDWEALAADTAADALDRAPLTPERTTLLLRRAIALAALGREADIRALRAAQAPQFAGNPSGPVFLSLTAPGAPDPSRLARAMLSLPATSPAGPLADLLPPAGKPAPAAAPAAAPAPPAPRQAALNPGSSEG